MIAIVAAAFFLYRYGKTENGAEVLSRAKMQIPIVGHVFKQLYLSRIAHNLATILASGVQI